MVRSGEHTTCEKPSFVAFMRSRCAAIVSVSPPKSSIRRLGSAIVVVSTIGVASVLSMSMILATRLSIFLCKSADALKRLSVVLLISARRMPLRVSCSSRRMKVLSPQLRRLSFMLLINASCTLKETLYPFATALPTATAANRGWRPYVLKDEVI